MRLNAVLLVSALLAMCVNAAGQANRDEEAVRSLPQAFNAAFNKHDAKELARLMAEDVDFVNVGLMWLQGRVEFEQSHARLFSTRFREITQTVIDTHVKFIRPEVAVVRFSWTVQGDTNPDGTPRTPRSGLMTMVAEKRGQEWLIAAAQNVNSPTGPIPPEAQANKPPMKIPRGQ